MDKQALRRETVATLMVLVERYPNMRIGQIIGNALGDGHDFYYIPDEEIARALNQLLVSWTQFEAAGVRP